MAFSAGPQAQQGPDLPEINTEGLGFHAIQGDTMLKLFSNSWPVDSLPPPTADLFAVASRKGFVAAASPDSLILSKTETVRKAFTSDAAPVHEDGSLKILPFTPELSLPLPRLSQVIFNCNEEYLIVCAQEGGGMRVYRTDDLAQGKTDAAFQIATNGISVRSLVPNPSQEFSDFVSVVLTSGQLLLADLNDRKLIPGANGEVMKEGVSCVSWSVQGRALVAGMGNGTILQMRANGSLMAEIPRPPGLEGDQHVASISWLSNDEFLNVYDPTTYDGNVEPSVYYVHRKPKTTEFAFQKMADPVLPFGETRTPPHYFIKRLKGFPPNLEDLLVLHSTTTPDLGFISKSSAPLASDEDANAITNVYTTTKVAVESRCARLPMPLDDGGGQLMDSTSIGFALDFSSTELITTPIPGDEMDKSPCPLPAVLALTHEGILNYWYIVYNASVRENKPYPGLVAVSGGLPTTAQPTKPAQPATEPTSFGGLGQSSALGGMNRPTASSFGQPSFGTAAGGSFGAPSQLGSNRPAWGAPNNTAKPQTGGSVFGQSAFGQPSAFGAPSGGSGSGFGAASSLGNKQSPWAAASQNKSQIEAPKPSGIFGQSASASSASSASPFAAAGNQQNTTGASPFGSFGGNTNAASPFATTTQNKSVFGQSSSGQSGGFASLSTEPSFGSTVTIGSSLGAGSTIGSSQKSVFGTPTPQSFTKTSEDEMADVEDESSQQAAAKEPEKPSGGMFGLGNTGFKLGSTFKPDETAQGGETPKASAKEPSFFGLGFSNALEKPAEKPAEKPVEKPVEAPKPAEEPTTAPPPAPLPPDPAIKKESESPPVAPEPAPLPPSPGATAKAVPEDAPLPPDPTPVKAPAAPEPAPEPAPLPPSPKFATPTKPASHDTAQDKEAPLAGSPPVEIHGPQPSDVSSRADETTDDEREKAPEAAPLPPDPTPAKSALPSWGFDSSPAQPLPKAPSPPKSPAPPSQGNLFSHTPAGLPKQAHFPPPAFKSQLSPRSPSPVRSISAPHGQPINVPVPQPVERGPAASFAPKLPEQTQPPKPRTPVEETEPELEIWDQEADLIRNHLASGLEARKELEPFVAHQDYAGPLDTRNKGIAGQIERVWRDVNSMVDTLGLNARSASQFVKGHTELYNENELSQDDLDMDPEEWCLDEIHGLINLEAEIESDLEHGRVEHPEEKISQARALARDIRKMRNRVIDLRKRIEDATDPSLQADIARQPLTAQHAAQRKALRDQFNTLQTLLGKLEEALTLLRVKLAAVRAASAGSASESSGSATPTVEAVVSTIQKMTAMAQRKSGDIDVLESQLRKLRMSTPRSRQGTPERSILGQSALGRSTRSPRASREPSPFVTPPRHNRASGLRSAGPTPLREGSYGFSYDDGDDEDEEQNTALMSSVRSFHSTRSEINEKDYWINISHEDVRQYRADSERRSKVGNALKQAILRLSEKK